MSGSRKKPQAQGPRVLESAQQFAKVVWEKRFNAVRDSAYVTDMAPGTVFAVGVLGTVTLAREDVPHLINHLRQLADALEHYVASEPHPSPSARSRAGKHVVL